VDRRSAQGVARARAGIFAHHAVEARKQALIRPSG
jgi:hypothetical protein